MLEGGFKKNDYVARWVVEKTKEVLKVSILTISVCQVKCHPDMDEDQFQTKLLVFAETSSTSFNDLGLP